MDHFPLLVADIGGTNARFALVTGRDSFGNYQLDALRVFNTADFTDFVGALQAYLNDLDGTLPRHACLAVAGPVKGDVVSLTNIRWTLSKAEICERFSFLRVEIVNDFAALACATACLRDSDLVPLKAGSPDDRGVKAIVGPGTGFGVAALVWTGEHWQALSGEGGHAAFAPRDELEIEILHRLSSNTSHVSRETLLCGRGLVTLYQTLAGIRQQPARFHGPEQITAAGSKQQPDPLCEESLRVFSQLLAGAAADIALTYGARGGVYVGGGIASQITPFLQSRTFAERFTAAGQMSHYLTDIPVYLINHAHPALIGAALRFETALHDGLPALATGNAAHG